MSKKERNTNEPNVKIFGEEVNSYRRRRRGGRIIWGVLFLLIGVILFFNNLGIIPWQFWDHVWVFWPLILILTGINMIFGYNVVSQILVTAITIALFGFVVIYGISQVRPSLLSNFPPGLVNSTQTLDQFTQTTK